MSAHPELIMAIVADDEDKKPLFYPRDLLEENPIYRQIIPIVILCGPNNTFLAFRRGKAGSEARLHGLWSVCWGGHVEECDIVRNETGAIDFFETTSKCARREVLEETGLDLTKTQLGCAEFGIRLDGSIVDRCHEAVVYFVQYDGRPLKIEVSAEGAAWLSLGQLQQLMEEKKLETWAHEIVADLIRDDVVEGWEKGSAWLEKEEGK